MLLLTPFAGPRRLGRAHQIPATNPQEEPQCGWGTPLKTLSFATVNLVVPLQVALGVAHRQAAAAQTQPSGALVERASCRGFP